MRIGVVGYSRQRFHRPDAIFLLEQAFAEVGVKGNELIVSGLTDLGVPGLAYAFAVEHGLKTIGIACSKAKNYDCFPCNRVHIIGDNWGDESETFLASIDYLIRIGGGKQSRMECERAKELGIVVIEKELEALPNQ